MDRSRPRLRREGLREQEGVSSTIVGEFHEKTVYLSLGSNLGDRVANLEAAMQRLQDLGAIVDRSSLYETEPVETPEKQPWFLNCAVALETGLMPQQLLSRILAIEQEMGRKRLQPKGPRTVDIDIVLFGKSVVETASLTIPHTAMHQRRFVLEPLAEIAPDVWHPVYKKTARELLNALPTTGGVVRRLNPNETKRAGLELM